MPLDPPPLNRVPPPLSREPIAGASGAPRVRRYDLSGREIPQDEWGLNPALPPAPPPSPSLVPGLTLRDWFAGQALVGIYSGQTLDGARPGEVARDAYAMADAMLKARENGK